MDKFRQSFALEESGHYLKPGGDEQVLVKADSVLKYVMSASEQDCPQMSKSLRSYMASVNVSGTHDTNHVAQGRGVAKYELTIRGSAWYIFKPNESKSTTTPQPVRIVEVKAGNAILIQGECYEWEYFLLRTDLQRPGPTELASQTCVRRVSVTITYGVSDRDYEPQTPTQDLLVTLETTTPTTKGRVKSSMDGQLQDLPGPYESPKPKPKAKARQSAANTSGTIVRDNFWLPDQANGKPVGAFQPTQYIQSRTAGSTQIFPNTTFRYQDANQDGREVHIVAVGRWTPQTGGVQRVVICRMRTLEISSGGLRPVPGWDNLMVVSASNVRTHTRFHTDTHTTHTRHTTHSCIHTSYQFGLNRYPWTQQLQVQHLPNFDCISTRL